MVIYGEYLFLENLATGLMILHLTQVFSGVRAARLRLGLGGACCGFYAFLIFVPMHVLPSLALKLAFSFTIVLLVFGLKKRRALLKMVLLFFFVSFAMGGITIGLMYVFGVTGVSANGAFYMGASGYLLVTMTAAAAYLMLRLVADLMKGRRMENRTTDRVNVYLNGRKAALLGLLDTGNFLADPVTGRPVWLMAESVLGELFSSETAAMLRMESDPQKLMTILADGVLCGRLRLIPYSAVGTEKGMLLGVRPDYIEIMKEGEMEMREDIILGVYHGGFGCGALGEPYGILMHADRAKGGLVCND